jgi:hypothetical protein
VAFAPKKTAFNMASRLPHGLIYVVTFGLFFIGLQVGLTGHNVVSGAMISAAGSSLIVFREELISLQKRFGDWYVFPITAQPWMCVLQGFGPLAVGAILLYGGLR